MNCAADARLRAEPMGASDLEWVLAIEQALFPSPWGERQFRESLAAGYECWVLRRGQGAATQNLGYGLLSVAGGEADLQNIAIASAFQRQGLAAELLRHLLVRAGVRGAERVFLEVRASNLPAISFYLAQRFAEIGRRKGYYPAPEGREDALVMALDLA